MDGCDFVWPVRDVVYILFKYMRRSIGVIHSCLLGRKIMCDKDNHYLDGDKHESLSSSNLALSGGW